MENWANQQSLYMLYIILVINLICDFEFAMFPKNRVQKTKKDVNGPWMKFYFRRFFSLSLRKWIPNVHFKALINFRVFFFFVLLN